MIREICLLTTINFNQYVVAEGNYGNDPSTYDQVMMDADSAMWQLAMRDGFNVFEPNFYSNRFP